ncbi:peripheral-type benzodiazepine receptor-associated protein 1 isoform X3 [Pangasianodon hypophthalmus]|uniref:peripheral-type benzodiazepine receptor-associated protein 1 isoform X3 n=1 Tax=Pangasianodon hypophthalmus TaxID=310915 RepID=UPI002307C3FE|nr:peripheral-type benzodiazepine receptor-associated protein 1 isoform X3 [Pangasianodon hypophthalmus]
MGKDEVDSNHQYLFSKKAILQSRSSSLSKKESKKVSSCHNRLQTPSQPVLGPGHQKEKALELPWTGLEHQHLDHTNLKQAGELRQRLADEIAGTVRPDRTAKAGKKWTGIDSGCKGNGATYRKLEELLRALHGEADKEQAGLLQCLWEEVELEKSYFLCHLLEVHGHPSLAVEEKEDKVTKGPAKALSWRSKISRSKDIPESFKERKHFVSHYYTDSRKCPPMKKSKQGLESSFEKENTGKSPLSSSLVEENTNKGDLYQTLPDVGWELQSSGPSLEKLSPSRCSEDNMEDTNGADYDYLVQQNSELLRALEDLEKTVSTLREENSLLRKSSCPETEDKVKRLRRKNAELAVIAKRLEERAHKLQEANLKVVNAPIPIKPGAIEQYKRAFARQRARDLAQHADTLLSKDKEIAALQQECRQLEARIGQDKQGGPGPAGAGEFERLLKESQKEVLRLQRQLSVSSARDQSSAGGAEKEREQKEAPVVRETPQPAVDEVLVKGEETHGEEEQSRAQVTSEQDTSSAHQEEQSQKDRIEFLESELSKKRKECEGLEHEVRKRQKRCLDLESQLEDERGKNERLTEEAELLRRKAQLLEQSQVENEELKEELSAVSARYSSVLEENQRLRAKLENLEQVLKHMREVAERRQQLELEHEQALAILKFKQDEIKRLQRAQLFAKREHEGVVQMLEGLIQFVLLRELAKVRELEQKCRNQSEQFSLLSQELDKFRQQASKIDLSAPGLLCSGLTQLPNGLSLPTDPDLSAVLRAGSAPYTGGLSQPERSPGTKHRELPSLNPKSTSTSSSTSPPKSENTHLSPKSAANSRKASPTHEVDTASEVEELDIDVSPVPFPASRGAAKLQVFIARYSYNPYDGPNDNPEVELPLTAGEYIYVYGDMDDDGFYEGELMDGRRGLVPSNFVERVSDDEAHEAADFSHNSFLESSFHSTSERPHQHQHHVRLGQSNTDKTETSATSDISKAGTVPLVNGLELDLDLEDDIEAHIVPHPHKLTLIKQLAKSIVLGWEAPPGGVTVRSYNVYVDQELRLSVPTGNPTKAVLERMDTSHKAHRVAVQSVTERGTSDPLRCCMLVGKDVSAAPTELRVERIMATSARLTWLPSNSSYAHAVSLNGELRELVQAGRYSLRLGDLMPGLHYRVEVEAQLPSERRERKCAVTSFTTLTAGPPDAPLDVQLEQGPTPGIAQISWLPVTIDAAGTSNGVRVTGYTIYADKKKVLEVSSPTAGSALIGPSQIEMLQAARELTVRTMSPHGESADSTPVNVPAKLPAIMAGASMPPCQPVPAHASVLTAGATNKEPSGRATSLSAAKTSTMPLSSILDANPPSPIRDVYANTPKAATNDAPLPTASYVEAWANPAVAAQEARPLPGANANLQETLSVPKVVPTPVPVPVAMPTASALASPAQPSIALTTALEPSRETESPGPQRSITSVSDFLDDPMPHKSSPMPSMPRVRVPGTDLLDVPDTHPLRPPIPSPVESEPEGDGESTRLVSIEEFLRPEPVPRTKVYAGGLMDPPPDYHVESSRSDLSDILEEEEEDLYSESAADVTPKNYNSGPAGRPEGWEADSDEEVLEKILKLHPQVFANKQLFSIPEVTEEEDNSESESHSRQSPTKGRFLCQPASGKCQPCGDKATIARSRGTTQVRPRPGTNYIDTVETTNYEDDEEVDLDSESSLYVGPCSREVTPRRSHRVHQERDRLRREALLRSHMTSHLTTSGVTAQGPYMLSRTVRHVKTPAVEIDVEYGTDNDDEASQFDPGEVVVEQMSSEWWVEGGNHDYHHSSSPRQTKQDTLNVMASGHHQWETAGLADSGTAWCGPRDISPKLNRSETRLPRDVAEPRPIGDSEVRIFVALFPYDPSTMSPNRDAAEEELPFREGQIIKVYGDKDADGFYRGESGGRHGYVPCNMVSEIQVDDDETRDQLLQQGFLSTETSIEKMGARSLAQLPHRPAPPPKPRRSKKVESTGVLEDSSNTESSNQDKARHSAIAMGNPVPRRMVAIFDYDPRESSPNADIEAELTFNAGDIIYVFGDMDDDGFFYGDLNGQKGLVPSNFLQGFPENGDESAEAEHTIANSRRDSQVSHAASVEQTEPLTSSPPDKTRTEPNSQPDSHQNLLPDQQPEHHPGPSPFSGHSPPVLHPPEDHAVTETSPPGKKKKGFFSKGKKLFKKLGSSKKE